MGLFTRRTPAHERSVAEIEADLEHYRERHALYLLTIRTLLYYIKEFWLSGNFRGSQLPDFQGK